MAFELAARELGAENYQHQHQQCRRTLFPAGRLLARRTSPPHRRRHCPGDASIHYEPQGQTRHVARPEARADSDHCAPGRLHGRANTGPNLPMVRSSRRPARQIHQLPHRTNAVAADSPGPAGARHRLAGTAQSDSDNRGPSWLPRRSRHQLEIVPRSVPRDDRLDGPTRIPTRVGPWRTKFSAISHARAGRRLVPLRPASTAQSRPSRRRPLGT